MRKNIIGKPAAALFAALIFLFSILIVSCGNGGGSDAVASPQSKSPEGSTAGATLTCTDVTCPTIAFTVKYDSTRGPGPKLKIYEGTAGAAIPAGTKLKLVVSFDVDSTSR